MSDLSWILAGMIADEVQKRVLISLRYGIKHYALFMMRDPDISAAAVPWYRLQSSASPSVAAHLRIRTSRHQSQAVLSYVSHAQAAYTPVAVPLAPPANTSVAGHPRCCAPALLPIQPPFPTASLRVAQP